LVWTFVMLVVAIWPLYRAITVGWIFVVYYLFAIPICVMIAPLVLRDVWKKVRNPDHEPGLVLPADPQPLRPGESIHDRDVPGRW
jgi:hypothetical protein